MYLLGYDLGSSSVKVSLLEASSGKIIFSAQSPASEMEIIANQPGWAEQDPEMWWENLKIATKKLKEKSGNNFQDIKAIGISYQMHGLVLVDINQNVLRPSIIWCDSRAVEIGNDALNTLGKDFALSHLFNSPGNFTASKLSWVKKNEPEIFEKIHKAMLPGDFIAMKLSGEINTTASGLSEGIFWDFEEEKVAEFLLNIYQIPKSLLPDIVPIFSLQAKILPKISEELGINKEAFISYRAGDQPNNAFSLNVLKPGEVAATAGTSGVIYGISDEKKYDKTSSVNTFLHVNHVKENPSYGILLCINGTGILNSWLKNNIMDYLPNENIYNEMNEMAKTTKVGSEGLSILPFGNGAERVLENKQLNASIHGLNFTQHNRSHLLRAAQEGIVFALKYGLDKMKTLGVKPSKIKAGKANMFLSPLFSEAFANTTGAVVELYNTDGATGAARGAGIGFGIYKNEAEAFHNLNIEQTIEPDKILMEHYDIAYNRWLGILENHL